MALVRRPRKKTPKAAPVPKNALEAMLGPHLEVLAAKQYSEQTIKTRHDQLGVFIRWCAERGLENPHDITRPVLERYQRYLFHYRKKNGQPLSFHSQHSRVAPVRVWFKWMVRQNYLLAKPASEIELPRLGYRLPKVLSIAEAETCNR